MKLKLLPILALILAGCGTKKQPVLSNKDNLSYAIRMSDTSNILYYILEWDTGGAYALVNPNYGFTASVNNSEGYNQLTVFHLGVPIMSTTTSKQCIIDTASTTNQ